LASFELSTFNWVKPCYVPGRTYHHVYTRMYDQHQPDYKSYTPALCLSTKAMYTIVFYSCWSKFAKALIPLADQ